MMITRRLTPVLAALLPVGLASPTPVSQQFKREVISGKYIITLREDVPSHIEQAYHCVIENTYNISTWKAYAGEFDDETIQQVKDGPEVSTVEDDNAMYHWSAGDSSISEATLEYNVVGGSHVDTLGHGTHVAGTIGVSTYGVAKQANLISVMIFSGATGTTRQTRCAINLSIGGSASSTWISAVNAIYSSGVLSVVATGNGDDNGKSPCFEAIACECPEYGAGVDILASGVGVLSSYIGSNTATWSLNGTSMATPRVVSWSCSVSPGSCKLEHPCSRDQPYQCSLHIWKDHGNSERQPPT
ncbi:putative Subtilase [Seiridium unicorne]|uniref:Subtilase n=1 Tax=Seiridium unicorne TaxID=138068 RepID=A0ABR2VES0_9PEZI